MKILKGFALSLLNFLLFVSLSLLGLVIALNSTILNPDFVIGELGKLDVTTLVKEHAGTMVISQFPPEFKSTATAALDKVTIELEPWVKGQVNSSIYHFYDYLMGRSESFSLTIATGEIKGKLHDILKEAFLRAPPKEFATLPPAMLEQGFELLYQQFAANIPSNYTVSESMLPPDALHIIKQVREYLGYYQFGYKALIALIAVLVLGIVLISRQMRGATRGLGTTTLIVGVSSFVEFYLANQFARPQLAMLMGDMPVQIKTWIPQVFSDLLAPIQTYSIGLIAAGVILLIVSFVYKPAEH